MKHKISPYLHNKILEIEQYANMDEWREGTLVEMDSDKVNVENLMKDLEKRLDLDSCEQVPVGSTQNPTPKPSASTTEISQRHTHETSAPPAEPPREQDQGTSNLGSKQSKMLEQPKIFEEQAPPQPHLAQVNMGNHPVLQTPLNEEKSLKGDREVANPVSGPSNQPGAKRHRLNPYSEEELFEETIGSLRKEGGDNLHVFPTGGTPSSSQR